MKYGDELSYSAIYMYINMYVFNRFSEVPS